MRTRALIASALIALPLVPCASSAQAVRRPPIDRRTVPPPAPLPPEAIPVARSLAYQRSRWSAEGYSMIASSIIPAGVGATTRYTTIGGGTHADYRYSDHMSATMDFTVGSSGGSDVSETAEVGTRYSPFSWEQSVRPFVDVRAGYMRMFNSYALPADDGGIPGTFDRQFLTEERYSRGFGGITGLGFEYSLSRSLALTTELAAIRNYMTTYRLSQPTSVPVGSSYWMTSFRYIFGLKFNPVHVLHLDQQKQ